MPTTNVGPECGPKLQEIADALAKSKKVVVITGAGISTNCGIPDFRSENGLYALIQAQYDAAAASKDQADDIDDRPTKRRKLDRSCSTGALPVEKLLVEEQSTKRQLRSSRSFCGTISTSKPAEDIVDQPRKVGRRRKTDSAKSSASSSQQTSRRQSFAPTIDAPTEVEELPSSQISVSSGRNSLPNFKGKDLFDSMIWTDALTTSIFYTFISSLRQKILNDVKNTTETHKFIKGLRDAGRLVRNYTQNIDMLESREGLCTELERGTGNRTRFSQKFQRESLPNDENGLLSIDSGVEVVHLHGSLDRLRCGLCARSSSWDEEDRHQATLAGEAPNCPWCIANSAKREDKGRRSLAIGRLRPDIVLYGEEHPSAHLVAPLIRHDLSLGPDILLILGTSLRVHGLKVMVKEFAKAVHMRGGKVVFVNQTKPPDSIWGDVIDYWVEWDCDAWVEDLKERRKEIWLPPRTANEVCPKQERPRPIPKNPLATRPDTTSGAYLTMRIVERLGRLSGRISDVTVQPANDQPGPVIDVTEDGTKKRKISGLPRPNAIRLHKENGAYLVSEIMTNLRRLCDGLVASLSSTTATPLAIISANIPGRRRARLKGSSTKDVGLPQLPTPPSSDQATPPLTPGSQRIKSLGRISAILSSPLRVWRDELAL